MKNRKQKYFIEKVETFPQPLICEITRKFEAGETRNFSLCGHFLHTKFAHSTNLTKLIVCSRSKINIQFGKTGTKSNRILCFDSAHKNCNSKTLNALFTGAEFGVFAIPCSQLRQEVANPPPATHAPTPPRRALSFARTPASHHLPEGKNVGGSLYR